MVIDDPVIEKINLATGTSFEDGEHVLYINGQYWGEANLGKLVHDFNCTQESDMNFGTDDRPDTVSKRKSEESEGDVSHHEDMGNESLKEGIKKKGGQGSEFWQMECGHLRKLGNIYAGLPLDEVKKLKAE